MASALAIVPTRGLTEAELIDIERLFDKLAKGIIYLSPYD